MLHGELCARAVHDVLVFVQVRQARSSGDPLQTKVHVLLVLNIIFLQTTKSTDGGSKVRARSNHLASLMIIEHVSYARIDTQRFPH